MGQFGEEGGFFFGFQVGWVRPVEGGDTTANGDGVGLTDGLFAMDVMEAFDGVGVLTGGVRAVGEPGVVGDGSGLEVVAGGSGADVAC